jgi:DNA-directed RNA polymerase subunit RPC12/RpoP
MNKVFKKEDEYYFNCPDCMNEILLYEIKTLDEINNEIMECPYCDLEIILDKETQTLMSLDDWKELEDFRSRLFVC